MAKSPKEIIDSVKKISSEYQKHIEMAKMKHADDFMLNHINQHFKDVIARNKRFEKGYTTDKVRTYSWKHKTLLDTDGLKKEWEEERNEISNYIKERDKKLKEKDILTIKEEYQNTLSYYQNYGGFGDFSARLNEADKSFMILTQKSETIDTMNTMLNNIKDEKDTLALEEYKMYVLGQGKDILSKHRDSHTSKFLNALARFLNFTPTGAKLVKSIEQHLTLFTNAIQTVQDKASETPTETHTSTPKNKD